MRFMAACGVDFDALRAVDFFSSHEALLLDYERPLTREEFDALPESIKQHLVCRVVDTLVPVTQKHDIEGLVMGADPA